MVEPTTGARATLSRPVRQEGVHLTMFGLEIEHFRPQEAATDSTV